MKKMVLKPEAYELLTASYVFICPICKERIYEQEGADEEYYAYCHKCKKEYKVSFEDVNEVILNYNSK